MNLRRVIGLLGASSLYHLEVSMLGIVLIVVLVLLVAGAAPTWSYSRGWGNSPVGVLLIILIIVLLLTYTGRI